MDKEVKKKKKAFSPSRTVWRTQMGKGIYTPHRVSRITCIVNQLLADKIIDFLKELKVTVYDETGRVVREHIRPRSFGLPGEIIKIESTSIKIFRFTVPRENSESIVNVLTKIGDLDKPGIGSIFSQDLMEFSKDAPDFNMDVLNEHLSDDLQFNLLNKLSYVICVLSDPGSGDQLAKIALDLGICVPVITYGSGNDIRDQLGLIRITIPAEKEIVHLLMPEQDSDSIIKLLVEHGRLDRPGKGFIYETPVTHGLIDTQMKIGNQKYAASMEQIIAAIDQLKTDTNWRKRLDADSANLKIGKSMRPQDNCEVSIISDEDRIDILRETCLDIGAAGAITSQIIPHKDKDGFATNLIKSAISVPALITDNVVDRLLSISTINDEDVDRIQVLDSPAAYVRSL
jgi:nitrogen regulatory protein PII